MADAFFLPTMTAIVPEVLPSDLLVWSETKLGETDLLGADRRWRTLSSEPPRPMPARDMVATLEYQAKGGTIQVDGQPCTLSKFRASTNYQTFSQRIRYACTRSNGQAYSNIEVVSAHNG